MDLKRKKIIAKEVLILSCVLAIIFVIFCSLWIVENNRKIKIQDLSAEKIKMSMFK